MKEIMARAKAEKEAKAKEEAERAQREREAKGAERTQVEQELTAATQELAGLETQLGEAETLAEQMAELPDEARAEFGAELAALRSETTALRERVAGLNERKQKLDTELGGATTAEVPTEIAAEVPAEAPAEVPAEAAAAEEAATEGVASQAQVAEAKPEAEVKEQEKLEPTPEESAKALGELSYNMVHSADSVQQYIGHDYSVETIVKMQGERTLKVEELQKTLQAFEGKDPGKLSESEKSQLRQAMGEAYGQTYYDIHSPGKNKPYDEKWPTALDSINKDITYFLEGDRRSLQEIQAEVAVLKGEDTPDKVGGIDLVRIREKLASLTAADKGALLESLQAAVSKGEEAVKKAEGVIQQNKEALRQSEPALRASARKLHNTLLDLDKLHDRVRKRFASVLK